MLEEQEQQQSAWHAQEIQRVQQQQQQQQPRPHFNQQYSGQNTVAPNSGDTMGEIQQQFTKIAESVSNSFEESATVFLTVSW
jgi:hypothetical protein